MRILGLLLSLLAAQAAALPAPGGLTATATGLSGTVQLAWTAVTPAASVSGYQVYHNSLSSVAGAASFFITSTAATVSGLDNRVTRWFFVATVDSSALEGSTGTAVSAAPFQAPDAPSLSATALAYSNRVQVGWTLPAAYGSNLGGIRLEAVAASGTSVLGFYKPSTQAAVAGFVCGSPVTLQARAYDAYGSSSAASAPLPLLLPCPPPISSLSITAGSLTLGWTALTAGSVAAWEARSATAAGLDDPLPSLAALAPGSALSISVSLPAQGQPLFVRVHGADAQGVSSAASAEIALLPPPSALKATPSKGKVNLSWSAPALSLLQGVTGWRVYYATHAAPALGDALTSLTQVADSGSVVSVTVSPLTDHVGLWFSVAALAGSQVGPASAPVSATPALPNPSFIAVSALSGTALSLSWTAMDASGSTPAAYQLWRATSASLAGLQLLSTTSATSLSGVAAPLTGTVGYYFVGVVDGLGAQTLATPPASAMLRLPYLGAPVLALGETANARVRLRWDAVPEAADYLIFRATQGTFALLGDAVTGLEAVDPAPVNGGPNAYRIHARLPLPVGIDYHVGPASNSVTAQPRVLPGIPGRWGGVDQAYLTVAARSSGAVDLRWTPAATGSSAISLYRIWRGFSPQSLSVVAEPVGVTLSAYRDTGASLPLQSLVYGVQAVDQQGWAGPRISGSVKAALPWPKPANLAATVLSGGVRLSWASPSGSGTDALSAYRVSRRWSALAPYDSLATVTSVAYTDLGAASPDSSQAGYLVQVLDVEGGFGSGATLTANLAAQPLSGAAPLAVSGITAVTLALTPTGVGVSLAWRPAREADAVSGYRVWRDNAPLTETSAVSLTDTPALGSNPVYLVQAFNAYGDGVSGTAAPAPIFVAPPQPQWVSAPAQVDDSRADGSLGLALQWQDLGAAADDYLVYHQTFAFSGTTQTASLVGVTLTTGILDLGVTASAQAHYAVLARKGGYSAATPVAQLSLLMPPAPPALMGLSAVAHSTGAWLGWNPDGNAVEYWVFRSTAPLAAYPSPSAPTRLTRTSVNSFNVTTSSGAESHYYGVAAANGLGRSAVTQTAAILPLGGVPSAFSAVAGYSSGPEVALQWSTPTASQYATAFNVYRASSAQILADGGGSHLAGTNGYSLVDASVATNTAYYYAVEGFGLTFSARSVTGPIRAYLAPSAPEALAASGGPGAVDFSWAPPSALQGVTGWALSLDVADALSLVPLSVSVTGHRVAGLGQDVTVRGSLRAFNSAGASASTVTVTALSNAVGSATRPISFTALAPYSSALTWQAKVQLSWSAPGAGTVVIYRWPSPMALSLAAGGPLSPYYISTVAGTAGLLTDTALIADGKLWDYAITAVSSQGMPGGESAPLAAQTVVAQRAAAPPGLTITAGNARVDLYWGALVAGSGGLAASPYRLHRRSGSAQPFSDLVDDAGFPMDLASNSYVDRSVSNGGTYFYYLSSVDASGLESREAVLLKDGDGLALPAKPLGPLPPPDTLIAVAGDNSVTLRWLARDFTAPTNARYNVYRRRADGDYSSVIPELAGVLPSFSNLTVAVLTLRDSADSLSRPANLVPYFYSISVVNAWGEGPKSVELPATPYRPLDPGPGNRALNLSVVGKKDVALSWGAIQNIDLNNSHAHAGYRVFRSQDGGNTYALLQSLSTTVTTYIDTGTQYSQAYTYRVVPFDAEGNEGYSYSLSTVVIPSDQNSLLVFRNAFNPALGEKLPLQFTLQSAGRVWVKLFTLNGEYVATIFDEQVAAASPEQPFISDRREWDGRNAEGQLVASGVYLIHLESPGFRQNARVAVIK